MSQDGYEENNIGWDLLQGLSGKKKDVEAAVQWFEKAAALGYTTAMINLGNVYEDREDYEKAYYWYLEAALAEDETGMFNVANMYYWGEYVDQDYQKAYTYFKKLYDIGSDLSGICMYLGLYAENGFLEKPDYKKAVEYYEEGIDCGDGFCASNLGRMYGLGIGVEKDAKRAFDLYKEALDLGDDLGYANLGYCYETGQGVEKDMELALHYYKTGADVGAEHCQEEYERCLKELGENPNEHA